MNKKREGKEKKGPLAVTSWARAVIQRISVVAQPPRKPHTRDTECCSQLQGPEREGGGVGWGWGRREATPTDCDHLCYRDLSHSFTDNSFI